MDEADNTPVTLEYAGSRPADGKLMADRQYAFAMDYILWHFFGWITFSWSGFRDYVADCSSETTFGVVGFAVILLWRFVFACKDGFSGRSPGKWAMGLRVVDSGSMRPIGFGQSIKRNLVLLFPLVGEIILYIQMRTGLEWFNRWSRCRVMRTDEDA